VVRVNREEGLPVEAAATDRTIAAGIERWIDGVTAAPPVRTGSASA
jgi:hypothetical protein